MPEFKCPRCGGWAFGTDFSQKCYDSDIEIVEKGVRCNSWQDGTAASNPFRIGEAGHSAEEKRTRGFKLCKWSGLRSEAICSDEEFTEMMTRRAELRARMENEDTKSIN